MSDASDAFAEAERRIEQALAEGAVRLDLNDLEHLEELPESIGRLVNLQVLFLDNTQVADITPLQYLTALQRLDLDNTPVANIAPLKNLSALQFLWLSTTQVADVAPLQNLPALQNLYLNNTQVADIAPLQNLPALQFLTLSNTQVADIAPLQNLSALQTLHLYNTQVADIAPLQNLSALQLLDLDNTQVTDLRPLLALPALGDNNNEVRHLYFRATPATAASPELHALSKIGDHAERIDKTLAFLRTLPPYPKPLPWELQEPSDETPKDAPPPDAVPRVIITDGAIDVEHVLPSDTDKADPVKKRAYERMQSAIGDLVRLGNRYPEINGPASALKTILEQPFEQADLFDIHIEIASLTDLIAANPDRAEAEQLDAECLTTLRKVTRLGPPLTLGTPEVDTFEARNLEYAQIRRAETIPYSERLIAAKLQKPDAPLTERAKRLAAISAEAPDEGRIAGVRVSYVKNILIQGVGSLAGMTVSAIYGSEVVSAYEWALTFLTTNKDAIMTVAPSWIENGQVWAADLIARSAELLEELRKRKGSDSN